MLNSPSLPLLLVDFNIQQSREIQIEKNQP